jgi:hypothetical protein
VEDRADKRTEPAQPSEPEAALSTSVTFVYCFAKIHQKECIGEEEGRLTYLWLIVLVFVFMLYGLYTWGFILRTRPCNS